MKTIYVKAQGQRKLVTDMGTLEYPKWYSQMAVITIGESVYRIFPTGFWKFRYELIKDGNVVLTVKNTWNGYQITKHKDLERPFTMTPNGFFKSGYTIKNHKQEVLLKVDSDFSWKKFQQDYKVICDNAFGSEELDGVFVLLSVYFYIQAMAAAAGSA
jgi:hypothetical protein